MQRRKVLRTLAIYVAVAWGAIAAAPDLLDYLDFPPAAFTVLLVVLALGLPVVLFASWYLQVFVDASTGPSAREPVEDLPSSEAEPDAAAAPKSTAVRWLVPAAVLVLALIGIVRVALPSGDDGALRILVHDSPAVGAEGAPIAAATQVIRQSLESLLGAEVLYEANPSSADRRPRDARRADADYLVVSQGAPVGQAVSLTVTLYRAEDGASLYQVAGGGPSEPLSDAAGRISISLVRALADAEGTPLDIRPEVGEATKSPVALTHYLDARRRFAETEFDAAAAALRRAIEADSTFIPAYYRLAVVERWRWRHDSALGVIDRVLGGGEIPPRWERLFRAQRAYLLRDVEGAIGAFEQVTLHHPELLDGWLGLGEALFHYGGFAGYRPADARSALERAVAGDSLVAPMRHHLAELALIAGDSAGAQRAVLGMAELHPVRRVMQLATSLQFGTPAQKRATLDSLASLDLRTVALLVAHFSFDPAGIDLLRQVASALMTASRAPEDRIRGARYLVVSARSEAERAQALSRWREVSAGAEFDPWIVHLDQAGIEVPEARRMLDWADAQMTTGRLPDFSTPIDDATRQVFLALVHDAVLTGDSARVSELLARIDATAPGHPTDPTPQITSAALRARHALLAADTAAAVRELETALSRTFEPFVTFYPLGTMAPERLLLMRLARALGDRPTEARWRNSFFSSMAFGDLVYQVWVSDVREDPPTPIPPSEEAA